MCECAVATYTRERRQRRTVCACELLLGWMRWSKAKKCVWSFRAIRENKVQKQLRVQTSNVSVVHLFQCDANTYTFSIWTENWLIETATSVSTTRKSSERTATRLSSKTILRTQKVIQNGIFDVVYRQHGRKSKTHTEAPSHRRDEIEHIKNVFGSSSNYISFGESHLLIARIITIDLCPPQNDIRHRNRNDSINMLWEPMHIYILGVSNQKSVADGR